jgi:hypothetical protein
VFIFQCDLTGDEITVVARAVSLAHPMVNIMSIEQKESVISNPGLAASRNVLP